MYYSVVGTLVTILVGIIVSYMTASNDDEYDEHLLHPCVLRLTKWIKQKNSQTSSLTSSQAVYENRGFQCSNDDGRFSKSSTNTLTTALALENSAEFPKKLECDKKNVQM